ncbi:MAG: transcription-repair coupling factor [Desulfonatronovibrionaceae bacterium]
MFLTQELKNQLAGLNRLGGHIYIHKSGPASQIYLARYLQSKKQNVVVLVPSGTDIRIYSSLAQAMAGDLFRPEKFWEASWQVIPEIPDLKIQKWDRIWSGLFSLINNNPSVSIVPAGLLLHFLPPRKIIEDHFLLVLENEDVSPDHILARAAAWGYKRQDMVSQPGEISRRGDILDIYPSGYASPVRMEFFGDSVESLRTFEPLSQRSLSRLEECLILPVCPCIAEEELLSRARSRLGHLKTTGELNPAVFRDFEEELSLSRGGYPPGIYYSRPGTFSDFVHQDTCFILADTNEINTGLEEEEWKLRRQSEAMSVPEEHVFQPFRRARKIWQNQKCIIFEKLVMGSKSKGIDLPEKELLTFKDLFWKPEQARRPWAALVEGLKDWRRTAHQVILAFNTEQSRKKFLKFIEQEQIRIRQAYHPGQRGIYALVASLGKGMDLRWNHLLVLGEDVLQPAKSRGTGRAGSKFAGIAGIDEIMPDDLVVHKDYGLGRFGGLQRVRAGRSVNDYLLIYYANDDKLYIPADRFSLVQRYKGPEGFSPALDRLGGTGWTRTKSRVRKAIEKIARDLVDMYAYRKVAKGFSYGPEGELFREFEATFGFEETPDQARAIKEVMEDMEGTEPMDRLVCGDVGFGKTEVAMRAAFRAVQDGKQVAVLCPTTVLAEQHYQNFRQRMEDLSVNVHMLSRFVPASRQKLIVEAAKRGEVDIIIGTHRILSKDVILPNLSLLILDEEQRFGVRHKEQLKKLRQNMDVLALTATPIPRTLQLSISGIRSLSVIETPPQDRKPVESSLIERDDQFLSRVIQRELDRQGQVFWVYNRVKNIQDVLEYVSGLAPHARIGMAHGQMSERRLEQTMHAFWHHELDILVCTAIIESGLDFPRANTLVVDQAQMFGLGQLYQLRGRVGRSERQAYAYFVVPSYDSLGKQAKKRMQVILDMDYLGAGFQVAMEDLRLRGAGNLLGEVQSGQIGKVGLDLFLDMLQEEVARQKGESVKVQEDPELSIGFPAFIPEDYIADPALRLRYYRILSACADMEELENTEQEIKDRFGHLPLELDCFVNVLKIKQTIRTLGAVRADFQENRCVLEWPEDTAVLNPAGLVAWVEKNQKQSRLLPPSKLELRLSNNESIEKFLVQVRAMVRDLAGVMT